VFAAQFEHLVAPAAAYLPAAHCVHESEPLDDVEPAGHVSHAVCVELAYLPASQILQDSEPSTEMLPVGQVMHEEAPIAE
jgi:hypothetical protein